MSLVEGGDYRIAVHDAGGVAVAELPCADLTGLTWGRVLSEVSQCVVSGNTATTAGVVQMVRPWMHWVSVWRDAEFVWSGLVTAFRVRSSRWEITAKDTATLMWRTRVPFTRQWVGEDPVEVAGEAWDAMLATHMLQVPKARLMGSTLSYDVEAVRDRRMLHQLVDDLVQLGVEWTVLGGQGLFFPALRSEQLALSHVRLSDCDFDAELEVVHDGSRLFTDVRVQGKNFASTAVRDYVGLRLQDLVSMDSLFGKGNIDRAARQAVARSVRPRAMLQVPQGAALMPDAPVDVRDLVPGVGIPVWTDLAGGVQAVLRLESVEVSVDGGVEKVSVTLGEWSGVNDLGELDG